MKKILFFSLFLLLFPCSAYAFVIQGTASSTTIIHTDVEGEGTATTHIESTVNGTTKILDSNQPGTYTLTNSQDSSESTQEVTQVQEPTQNPSITPASNAALPTKVKEHTRIVSINIFIHLQAIFHDAIQKLLQAFHI